MTLCPVTRHQCVCQPDEGVWCPDSKLMAQHQLFNQEQLAALTERNRELREALRDGLNLQSRWPLDKKIYPDEAAWIAKVRRLIEEKP